MLSKVPLPTMNVEPAATVNVEALFITIFGLFVAAVAVSAFVPSPTVNVPLVVMVCEAPVPKV